MLDLRMSNFLNSSLQKKVCARCKTLHQSSFQGKSLHLAAIFGMQYGSYFQSCKKSFNLISEMSNSLKRLNNNHFMAVSVELPIAAAVMLSLNSISSHEDQTMTLKFGNWLFTCKAGLPLLESPGCSSFSIYCKWPV